MLSLRHPHVLAILGVCLKPPAIVTGEWLRGGLLPPTRTPVLWSGMHPLLMPRAMCRVLCARQPVRRTAQGGGKPGAGGTALLGPPAEPGAGRGQGLPLPALVPAAHHPSRPQGACLQQREAGSCGSLLAGKAVRTPDSLGCLCRAPTC